MSENVSAETSEAPASATPAYDALTSKERAWVDAYLARGLNLTAASRATGSKDPARYGSRMAIKGHIRNAIRERLALSAMEADEVLHRLTDMGRASIEEVVGDDGEVSMRAVLDSGRAHLVKAFSHTREGPKVELHDAQAALTTLARVHGLLGPKGTEDDPVHNVTHVVNVEIVNQPQTDG